MTCMYDWIQIIWLQKLHQKSWMNLEKVCWNEVILNMQDACFYSSPFIHNWWVYIDSTNSKPPIIISSSPPIYICVCIWNITTTYYSLSHEMLSYDDLYLLSNNINIKINAKSFFQLSLNVHSPISRNNYLAMGTWGWLDAYLW